MPPAIVTATSPAASRISLAKSRSVPAACPRARRSHQKAADQVAQLGDALEHAAPRALPPALDHHLAVPRIECCDHPLARQRLQELGPRRRAEHDAQRPRSSQADRRLDRGCRRRPGRAPARSAPRPPARCCRWPSAASRSTTAISPTRPKLPRERARVAGVERLLLAADELHRLAVLQVDRGDDHGRSAMPSADQDALDVGDAEIAVVEDRGGEHRIGARLEGLAQMLRSGGTARGDHRHVDRIARPRGSARDRSRSACRRDPSW